MNYIYIISECTQFCMYFLQVCGWSDQQGEDSHLWEDAVEGVSW